MNRELGEVANYSIKPVCQWIYPRLIWPVSTFFIAISKRVMIGKLFGSVKPTLTYERGSLIREEVQTFSLWPLLLNGYRYSKARGVHVQHQCSGCGS